MRFDCTSLAQFTRARGSGPAVSISLSKRMTVAAGLERRPKVREKKPAKAGPLNECIFRASSGRGISFSTASGARALTAQLAPAASAESCRGNASGVDRNANGPKTHCAGFCAGGNRSQTRHPRQLRPGFRQLFSRRKFKKCLKIKGVAETEGFEPSIGLYNPITV